MSAKVEPIFLHDITKLQTKVERFEPYTWFHKMRNEQPVFYDADQDVWNVFLYDDVRRVLSDYELFSSQRSRSFAPVAHSPESKSNVNFVDPPVHASRRAFVNHVFNNKSMKSWETRIQAIADQLMQELTGRKHLDILTDFANPFSARVIANLLGVSSEDRDRFIEWSNVMFLPHQKGSQEEINQQKQAVLREFFGYLQPIVQAKRENPQDDIISALIQADSDGDKLSEREVIGGAMGILGGGYELTNNFFLNMFYCLVKDKPGLYQELRRDSELVPLMLEEVLRYRFPLVMDRQIAQDTNVFGPEMKKGQMIVAWISSANRDEAQFPNADEFDIHREGNHKHLTFGAGIHYCPGSPLARMEARIGMNAFLKTFSSLELDSSFEVEKHLIDFNTGTTLNKLPVIVQG